MQKTTDGIEKKKVSTGALKLAQRARRDAIVVGILEPIMMKAYTSQTSVSCGPRTWNVLSK